MNVEILIDIDTVYWSGMYYLVSLIICYNGNLIKSVLIKIKPSPYNLVYSLISFLLFWTSKLTITTADSRWFMPSKSLLTLTNDESSWDPWTSSIVCWITGDVNSLLILKIGVTPLVKTWKVVQHAQIELKTLQNEWNKSIKLKYWKLPPAKCPVWCRCSKLHRAVSRASTTEICKYLMLQPTLDTGNPDRRLLACTERWKTRRCPEGRSTKCWSLSINKQMGEWRNYQHDGGSQEDPANVQKSRWFLSEHLLDGLAKFIATKYPVDGNCLKKH